MNTLEQIVIDTGGDPYGSGDRYSFLRSSRIGEIIMYSDDTEGLNIKIGRKAYHATKARLQNKPSWDSHDWPAMVQGALGTWFGTNALTRDDLETLLDSDCERIGQGKVIGNWRDTLESRPVELQYDPDDVAFKFNESEAEGTVLFNGEIGGGREWRGPEDGLPPVGADFDWSLNGKSWESGTMLFNDGITCLIAHREYPASRWHYKCDDPDLSFRPLQSERDRWIEDACKKLDDEVAKYNVNIECSAAIRATIEAIYDAGLGSLPQCKN